MRVFNKTPKGWSHTILRCLPLLLLPVIFAPVPADGARIKDIANLHGARNNQLIGYGLITGLNGTGDNLKNSVFTRQAIYNMMTRQGITLDPDNIADIKIENVAAVMVTASLPPFAQTGSTIDAQVSSMGDASSLAGGTLLMTPLTGPDGNVYAVAQGPLTIGAFSYGGKTATVQQNHPTVGRIAGGAIIEKTIPLELGKDGLLQYQLHDGDFTTATNMATAINQSFGQGTAYPDTPTTVEVKIPENYKDHLVEFVAAMEKLNVNADSPARVVVNERTGTIVMGKDVRLSTVAVSHGNLNLIIRDDLNTSQPNPLAEGDTVITPKTDIAVSQEEGELMVLDLNKGVSIGEIANALNAIGASPRDLIAIFQAIKAAGSLQGELIVL